MVLLHGALKKLCCSLGLAESVEFTGMIRNVTEYLRNADLFVLPSRTEGLSNALLEAMSYGLPCIATKVGGNIEVIGEDDSKNIMLGKFIIARNGLLVNPDDVERYFPKQCYILFETEWRGKKWVTRQGYISRRIILSI